MEVRFLGTGGSLGIPVMGCKCEVCVSPDKKNKRFRPSVLIRGFDKNILIDIGPDFRQQMLQNEFDDIDYVLITHHHNDHISGLDDIRPVNFIHRKDVPIYAEKPSIQSITNRFDYIFDNSHYPGIPQLKLHEIGLDPFKLDEKIEIIPIRVMHGKMPILGFRLDQFVYITDASFISSDQYPLIEACDTLVINALRPKKHHSHFNLDEALELIKRINPKKAYLTHIGHKMGLHEEVNAHLPENILLAHDGLSIKIK